MALKQEWQSRPLVFVVAEQALVAPAGDRRRLARCRVLAWLKDWAELRGLAWQQDAEGNMVSPSQLTCDHYTAVPLGRPATVRCHPPCRSSGGPAVGVARTHPR